MRKLTMERVDFGWDLTLVAALPELPDFSRKAFDRYGPDHMGAATRVRLRSTSSNRAGNFWVLFARRVKSGGLGVASWHTVWSDAEMPEWWAEVQGELRARAADLVANKLK